MMKNSNGPISAKKMAEHHLVSASLAWGFIFALLIIAGYSAFALAGLGMPLIFAIPIGAVIAYLTASIWMMPKERVGTRWKTQTASAENE